MKWREEIKPTRTGNCVTVRPGSNRQHGSFLDTLSPVIFKKSWLRLVSSQWLRLVSSQWLSLESSQYRLFMRHCLSKIFLDRRQRRQKGGLRELREEEEETYSILQWRERTTLLQQQRISLSSIGYRCLSSTLFSRPLLRATCSFPTCQNAAARNQNWSAEIAVREFTRHRHHS